MPPKARAALDFGWTQTPLARIISAILVGRNDAVQALETVNDHGRGMLAVEALERGMRAIRVVSGERAASVDKVLSQHARGDGFADTTFFPTDEIERAHRCIP